MNSHILPIDYCIQKVIHTDYRRPNDHLPADDAFARLRDLTYSVLSFGDHNVNSSHRHSRDTDLSHSTSLNPTESSLSKHVEDDIDVDDHSVQHVIHQDDHSNPAEHHAQGYARDTNSTLSSSVSEDCSPVPADSRAREWHINSADAGFLRKAACERDVTKVEAPPVAHCNVDQTASRPHIVHDRSEPQHSSICFSQILEASLANARSGKVVDNAKRNIVGDHVDQFCRTIPWTSTGLKPFIETMNLRMTF